MKPRRKKYFINKRYQSEFVLKFCVFVAIGCLVFGLFLYMFSGRTLTTSFENSRLVVKSTADYLLPGLVFGGLIVALIMAIAVSFQIVLMTHKVAGPMYRFEKYAELVASGELSSNLKIRKKDQFQ
ncbi:MAG: hypothetical protein QGI05_04325, partial [Candidatus Omnitrophota bacterium]|nr:hypothetical protein [Candidatus Omnitrophota bacterium]